MNLLKKLASLAKSPTLWQAVTALVAILALGVAWLAYRIASDTAREQQRESDRQKRIEIERVVSRVFLSNTSQGSGCERVLCVVVENRSKQDAYGVFLRLDDGDQNTVHDVPSGNPIGDIPACSAAVVATQLDVTAGLYGLSVEFSDGKRYWRKWSPQAVAAFGRPSFEEIDPGSTLSNGPGWRSEKGIGGVLSFSEVRPCD